MKQSNIMASLRTLRKMGATVKVLRVREKEDPDLLVGYRGTNYLFKFELEKDTTNERQLYERLTAWRGQIDVIGSIDEVIRILTVGEWDMVISEFKKPVNLREGEQLEIAYYGDGAVRRVAKVSKTGTVIDVPFTTSFKHKLHDQSYIDERKSE